MIEFADFLKFGLLLKPKNRVKYSKAFKTARLGHGRLSDFERLNKNTEE